MISKFTQQSQQSQHQVTSTKQLWKHPLKNQKFNFLSCQTKSMCFIVEYCCFFFNSWEFQKISGLFTNLKSFQKTHPKGTQKSAQKNRSKTQWLDKHRPLKAEPPGNRFEVALGTGEFLGVKKV